MAQNKAGPKPGHFLPGGAGETGDLAAEPLPDAPVGVPLTGTQQARRVGWQGTSMPSVGAGGRYSSEPPQVKPPRRFSTPVTVLLSVLAILTVSGGAVASLELIDSYDNVVDSPLTNPTVHHDDPAPIAPNPTVTVTATPVPDAVRVKQNQLYRVGQLASADCKEPSVRPTGKANVRKLYAALLSCLNKVWAPLVRKAGYPFREPHLVMDDESRSTPCAGAHDAAFYCGDDETITITWRENVKSYRKHPVDTRVEMMDTIAHEYGHHVQLLTNIMISSASRAGWAKTNGAKLEETRRLELQATCFGAAFVGANKDTLLGGGKLRSWQFQAKHSGDEYNPKKVRDHGSRKNNWAWAELGFRSTGPASCNTFAAPAVMVS